jgi:hypothetical protein
MAFYIPVVSESYGCDLIGTRKFLCRSSTEPSFLPKVTRPFSLQGGVWGQDYCCLDCTICIWRIFTIFSLDMNFARCLVHAKNPVNIVDLMSLSEFRHPSDHQSTIMYTPMCNQYHYTKVTFVRLCVCDLRAGGDRK